MAPREAEPRTVKFLCCFGGKILPRPGDGFLRYVGGETRIVDMLLPRDTSYADLAAQMRELYKDADIIKYQPPGEHLDALVSVVNDDDVVSMMEEYDKVIAAGEAFTRLRIFLFSQHLLDDDVVASSSADDREMETRYLDALNSLGDVSSPSSPPVSAVEQLSGIGGNESRPAFIHSPVSQAHGYGEMDGSCMNWVVFQAHNRNGEMNVSYPRDFPISPSSSARFQVEAGDSDEWIIPDYFVRQSRHSPSHIDDNLDWLPPGAVVQQNAGFPGMDNTATESYTLLEEKLHDPTASPIPLPFEFLKDITCDFSEERELGRGGYGVVYKGVLRSGKIIAVKKLFENLVDDDQFQKEVTNLIEVKHQNIVQLVGYCAESKSEAIKLPSGNYVMAQIPKSVLCFEYLGNKGLDKHLSDESCGLDWNKRYEIIKGICNGLHFLHGECHIVHMDLKPANILMDDAMMPKIADFGLSKLLGAQKSRTIVSGNRPGSFGYMAPEYLWKGVVSPKADIFSFGVIMIEIITGVKEYPISTVLYSQEFSENVSCQSTEISLKKYTDNVTGRWRDVFEKEPKHSSPEIYTKQVEQCITTALECLNCDSTRRPTASDISQMLTGRGLPLDIEMD